MLKKAALPLFSGALLALAACSSSPNNSTDDKIAVRNGASAAPMGPAPEETHGQDFVSTVLGRYDFALQSARLATQKADRADVKQYGQRLIDDLSRSLDELKTIAATDKLKLEPAPADTAQTDLAVLSSTRGAPLEKAFADRQLDNLSSLVGTMRAYKNGGDNPQLKAWAEKYQAVINDRLLDLQTLNAALEEEAEKKAG